MFLKEMITDFNGFVLFDPVRLERALGRPPVQGEDLYSLFRSSDLGDRVVAQGAILPILGLTDGGYEICVRTENEPSPFSQIPVYANNGEYPLVVETTAYLADLAVLDEWCVELDWQALELPRGTYSGTVAAHLELADGAIERAALDVCLSARGLLPALSADLAKDMNVLNPLP